MELTHYFLGNSSMNLLHPYHSSSVMFPPESSGTAVFKELAVELSPLIKALKSDIRWQKLIRFVYKALGTLLHCRNLKAKAEVKSNGISKADGFVKYLSNLSGAERSAGVRLPGIIANIREDLPAACYVKTWNVLEKLDWNKIVSLVWPGRQIEAEVPAEPASVLEQRDVDQPAGWSRQVEAEVPAEPVSVLKRRDVSRYQSSFGDILKTDFSGRIRYNIANSCPEQTLLAMAALLYDKDSQPVFSVPQGTPVLDEQLSLTQVFGDLKLWTKGKTSGEILELLQQLDGSKVYLVRTVGNNSGAGHFQLFGQHDNEWYSYSTLTNQVRLTDKQGTVMSKEGAFLLASKNYTWGAGSKEHSIGYVEIDENSRDDLDMAIEYVRKARIHGEGSNEVVVWLADRKQLQLALRESLRSFRRGG